MGNTNVRLVPPTKEIQRARMEAAADQTEQARSNLKGAAAVDLKAVLAAIVKDLWEVRADLEREFPANHPVIALCAQVQKLSVMIALLESKR